MHLPTKTAMSSRTKLSAVCGIAAIGLTATALVIGIPALATPGSGFEVVRASLVTFPEIDAKADKFGKWDLFLKTKDRSTIGVDLITVRTGGYSGWHSHRGITLVSVKTGQISVQDGETCAITLYQAGEGFVDGANHSHNVSNPYGLTAELVAVQMRPFGTPGRVDIPVAPPNCP